jgi:hypothetical protein
MIHAMRPGRLAPITIALAVGLATPTARAQDTHARADALFDEGRALMTAGNFDAACPKFEESQRLDPALGTLFNIGLCVEGTGKLAAALAIWRDAHAQATAAREPKRIATAAEHIAALEARVPTVAIHVSAATPGLRVTIAGHPVADLATPVPVDPGDVAITATAPDHEPFATTITAHEHDRAVVVVPALAETISVPGPSRGRARRPLAYGLAGGGLVAIGVGTILGLSAKSKYDGAFTGGHCDRATLACDDAGQATTDAARGRGTVATVVGALGLAALAAGVYVYISAPTIESSSASATALIPTASPDGAGVALVGRF